MYRYVLLIISFSIYFVSLSQEVVIKGNAGTYAGDVLNLQSYSDLISKKVQTIASCKVAENGDFEFKFNAEHTIYTFIDLSVFKVFLYAEPDSEYTVILPKKTKKLPEDEFNPFFKAEEYYLKILNTDKDELNNKIRKFDNLYNLYLDKYVQFKNKLSYSMIDSIITNINSQVGKSNNVFFENYKTYSYYYLYFIAKKRANEILMKKYYAENKILYNNPAYINLFNFLFDNYLSYLAKQKKGKKVPHYLIHYRSLSRLKMLLGSVTDIKNDTLQEMVICKSLYDNFYKEDFPHKSIIAVIDSIKHHGANVENRNIASNIYDKITKLLTGYPAPDFTLNNAYKRKVTLSKQKGHFVYLNFVNPKSYTCLKDLQVLKVMHEKKYESLKIITVCVCDNIKEMKTFIKKNKFRWTFLYYSDNKVLNDYNVRVYPSYYMINPEGKFSMSPAFEPTADSFEARYFDILKSWKKEIRKQQMMRN